MEHWPEVVTICCTSQPANASSKLTKETRTRCEIYSKSTIKTPDRRQCLFNVYSITI